MNNIKHQPSSKIPHIALSVALSFNISDAKAEIYAGWLTQIGLTEEISSAAKWGRGLKLGVVDTGILASSPFFSAGQVSKKLSACAAITFRCSNGYVDDHGHGTAVAAIAAGNLLTPWSSNYGGYNISASSVVSLVSGANIVAEKVLNAAGSGYSTDVANGIRKAADAGAAVINVSITYGNGADIISSINYAASKGAFIVWAGGNSATGLLNGANSNGLTTAALNRLVFAGSVDANNEKSYFSNTPGSGALTTSNTQTAYANRWVMAPGENILAPYDPSEPSAWSYWSGTSMSTPLVSGSLILLQSAWPILKTNGSAANLLIATATDLGATGLDETYGNGLVNLTTAFQPYGELNIKGVNGKNIAVSSLTGAMISSGALGKLSKVKSKLANYTAFDTYQRNFGVNLSNMIKSPSTSALLNPLPTNKKTKPLAIKLADGTVMNSWMQEPSTAFDHLGEFNYNASQTIENQLIYFSLDYQDGTTITLGNGYSAQYAYGQAFYGDSELAMLSSELSTSGLSALADGGKMFSYGSNISEKTRLAFSWSNTDNQSQNSALNANQTSNLREASHIKMGLSYKLSDQLTGGITLGSLSERNGLLGSEYQPNSAISFNNNHSINVDFSAAYRINDNNSFLMEAGYSVTKSGQTKSGQGSSLITGTSDINAQSFGATLSSKNFIQDHDQLRISIKQPLRVTSGKAGILTASVDALGYAIYSTEWASLAPTGREIDYLLSYETPIKKNQSLNLQAGYREDVMNVNGDNDASIGASYKVIF